MLAGKDTGSSVDHDVLLCFSGPELALGATKPQGVNLERSFGASAKWGVWDLGIRGGSAGAFFGPRSHYAHDAHLLRKGTRTREPQSRSRKTQSLVTPENFRVLGALNPKS